MKQTIIRKTEANVERCAVAFIPSREDIEAVKVGSQAPDCFSGKLGLVTAVSGRGNDINGKAYVCYTVAMDSKDTVDNGCGCSNSMKEGEVLRTVALTSILNSDEVRQLEAGKLLNVIQL